MTHIEKVKHIREITMSPMNKIKDALLVANDNVSEAIDILIKEKQTDTIDMANRIVNAGIVYSYVHNYKVGAMIVLACQTDFAEKNEIFINLAKDICMHICSTPIAPSWVSQETLPLDLYEEWRAEFEREFADGKKPPQVVSKIVAGKLSKRLTEMCLLNQLFVRDDKMTIQQLVQSVSSTLGEKIEVKRFIKMKNDIGYVRINADGSPDMNMGIRPEYSFTSLN